MLESPMRKPIDPLRELSSEALVDAVCAWTKVSDTLYVHETGARIERLRLPAPGWYLRSPEPGATVRWFEPTPEGCDAAFVAFAGKRAAMTYLARLLKRAA